MNIVLPQFSHNIFPTINSWEGDMSDMQAMLEWQIIPRDGYKKCRDCKVWKGVDEFRNCKNGNVGKHAYCIECTGHYDRFRVFKLSREKFFMMKAEQNDKCKCCSEPLIYKVRRYAIDHCHETDQIRGILCGRCNRTLGLVEDNVELLKKLIVYLGG